ncbi:MAG: DUF6036 family nucleotidyltransferase [Chloroflexota bacterium]
MREYAERSRIDHFLRTLGRRLSFPIRLYLVGGSIIVDLGLRAATLDLGYVVDADDTRALEDFERLIPVLKNELQINVEPASPADFIPVPANVLARSPYVRSYGKVSVYYYDLPSVVISKVARGAERDLADIESLVQTGAVTWQKVEDTWQEMRKSPRGWLRHDPAEIERKLQKVRQRLAASGVIPKPE